MEEVRKFRSCALVEDGSNIIKVEWDIFIDNEYSHTYEQFYTKESKEQFITDVSYEVAQPFINHFD